MRIAVIAAALAVSLGSCTPNAGDACGDNGKVTCGHAGDTTNAVLLCTDGHLAQHGACFKPQHGCGGDPTGDNDVWCDSLPNTYGAGVNGTACQTNGFFVCDADDKSFQLKCIQEIWTRAGHCDDNGSPGSCGETAVDTVGCVVGQLVNP